MHSKNKPNSPNKANPCIEVHVAAICFHKERCLILKRSSTRSLYPDLWECGGGRVRAGEDFESTIKRQMREEARVKIKILKPLKVYKIEVPERRQRIIPGVKFVCRITEFSKKNDPQISREHSDWRFIDKSEIENFKFIPGIDKDIAMAFDEI